jgi:hypothetical protein
MSRVAATIAVGLCFLAGCKETPQQTTVSSSYEVFPERQIMPDRHRTPSSDIFIVPDPNDSIALQDRLKQSPQPKHYPFIIRPRPGVDYKIVAIKPNPNIDYKILNPMQKNHESLMQELKERQDIEKQNKIYEFPPQLPDPNR